MASTNFQLFLGLALPAFICGYPRPMLSIAGGAEPTEPNQYPWMLALLRDVDDRGGATLCGSALVRLPGNNDSSDIVLTAAHCVTDSDDTNASGSSPSSLEKAITVYARAHMLKDIVSGQVEASAVSRVEIHPKYTRAGPYDIAILKLSKPLKFDDKIQGIELPRKGHVLTGGEEEKCILAGWGQITDIGELSTKTRSLMHMNVSVASAAQCEQRAKLTIVVEDGKVLENDQTRLYCVYSGTWENTKPSVCEGDSGGPLFCKDDRNNWITHGIASSGPISCDAVPSTGLPHPGFYVKLDGHLEWIKEKIEALSSA